MAANPIQIAMIGMGGMGLPMANAIAAAGFSVRAWSRTEPAGGLGDNVHWHADLADAVACCDVTILMLTDAAAVDDVLFNRGLAGLLSPGSIVVDMGTTGVEHARNVAQRLATASVHFADAPVSGGTRGAQAASLTIFVGADDASFARLIPVLSSMGKPHHMGAVGMGQAAKLANQAIVGVTIAAVAEGLHVGKTLGLNLELLLDALEDGFADSTILRVHGPRMAYQEFGFAGAIKLHLKDLKLLAEAMGESGARTPRHVSLVSAGFERLVAEDNGHLDHSAYYLTAGA